MKPMLISENIEPFRDQGRTHFISFLYRCELVEDDSLRNLDQLEIQNHLGWFDRIPDNFLSVQSFYKSKLEEILVMEKNNAI